MKFDVASMSEAGPRPVNEDSVGVWMLGPETLVAAVADGLGGHSAGEVASKIAIDYVGLSAKEYPEMPLRTVAETIHEMVVRGQSEKISRRGMATTLTAVVLKNTIMEFVHCGDCRIAVARGNGIRRLTTDHSEAQRLFSAGKLTKQELASYPRKNVLESALGMPGDPNIDSGEFHILPGDKIAITSDGIHIKIMLQEIMGIMNKSKNADEVVLNVKKEMSDRGADDNYSAVFVFVS